MTMPSDPDPPSPLALSAAGRWRWEDKQKAQLPFPTFLGSDLPGVTVAAKQLDPYHVYHADTDFFEETWKGD